MTDWAAMVEARDTRIERLEAMYRELVSAVVETLGPPDTWTDGTDYSHAQLVNHVRKKES